MTADVSGYWLGDATAEEFLDAYDPETWPSGVDRVRRKPLLWSAIDNPDPATRSLIAHRLLDDGADAAALSHGYTLLHGLLGRHPRDPEIDPPLVRRLIAAGADMNRVAGRRMDRPVEVVDHPKLSPEQHEPYYQAFFERPGLVLLDPNPAGLSVLDRSRNRRTYRPQLLEHVMAYLDRTGQTPVGEPLTQTARWQTLDEILAQYTPADATAVDPETGDSLLHAVLRSSSLDVRTTLVPLLLAHGADATLRTAARAGVLQLALAPHGQRDARQDAQVVTTLLDAGADVNALSRGGNTPLTTLAALGNFPEEKLEPLYDVLLAAPGLDLTVVGAKRRTVLDAVRKRRQARPLLLARVEALAAETASSD